MELHIRSDYCVGAFSFLHENPQRLEVEKVASLEAREHGLVVDVLLHEDGKGGDHGEAAVLELREVQRRAEER